MEYCSMINKEKGMTCVVYCSESICFVVFEQGATRTETTTVLSSGAAAIDGYFTLHAKQGPDRARVPV